MKPLEKKLILGADGKTVVYVYDGNVDYRPTKDSINYRYYWNENGKRCKTRPYVQYSAMTNRCKKGGKHKENFQCYETAHLSESFKSFDDWCDWANNQVGYMCQDDSGNLYQQDKDLLGNGNGLYSENTCCFTEPKLNMLLQLFNDEVKGVRVNSDGTYMVLLDGKLIRVQSKPEALYLAFKRDVDKLKSYIDSNFSVLDEKVLDKLMGKIGELKTREFSLCDDKLEKAKNRPTIEKFKSDLSTLLANKTTKRGVNLPKNITQVGTKNPKFRVQILFRGIRYITKDATFSKLLDAEVFQTEKFLELLNILESEYCHHDFIPQDLKDKLYLSKTQHQDKLTMLLSNMF